MDGSELGTHPTEAVASRVFQFHRNSVARDTLSDTLCTYVVDSKPVVAICAGGARKLVRQRCEFVL